MYAFTKYAVDSQPLDTFFCHGCKLKHVSKKGYLRIYQNEILIKLINIDLCLSRVKNAYTKLQKSTHKPFQFACSALGAFETSNWSLAVIITVKLWSIITRPLQTGYLVPKKPCYILYLYSYLQTLPYNTTLLWLFVVKEVPWFFFKFVETRWPPG